MGIYMFAKAKAEAEHRGFDVFEEDAENALKFLLSIKCVRYRCMSLCNNNKCKPWTSRN